jgi:hypothetical protein
MYQGNGKNFKMCVRLESMKLCRHGYEIYVNVHLTYYWKFIIFIEFFIITHSLHIGSRLNQAPSSTPL